MRIRISAIVAMALLACTEQPVALDPTLEISPAIAKGNELKGRILFTVVGAETDIYSMNVDGTGAINLTPGPWGGTDPDWSPRNKLIVFSDNRFGSYDIFVMREDGTGVTRLTFDADDEQGPTWSPDGRKIAFASNDDGDYEIYTMNADGTGVLKLTDNGTSDFQPAWSPAGDQIAFITFGAGWDDLAVMDADGTDSHRLTDVFALNRFDPAWSPRGDRIAFFECAAQCGIKLVDIDGGNPILFDPTPVGDASPAWSPDARQIAFHVNFGGGACDIFRMNADGTTMTQLTFTGQATGVCNTSPDWYR